MPNSEGEYRMLDTNCKYLEQLEFNKISDLIFSPFNNHMINKYSAGFQIWRNSTYMPKRTNEKIGYANLTCNQVDEKGQPLVLCEK